MLKVLMWCILVPTIISFYFIAIVLIHATYKYFKNKYDAPRKQKELEKRKTLGRKILNEYITMLSGIDLPTEYIETYCRYMIELFVFGDTKNQAVTANLMEVTNTIANTTSCLIRPPVKLKSSNAWEISAYSLVNHASIKRYVGENDNESDSNSLI